MKATRRDWLTFGGGALAGLFFTPAPWKVLDDVSIWTQNWPWIPQPARGPVDVKRGHCALCAAGCGMQVRMAGGYAVGLSGVSGHPVSRGTLCPLGFGAHQLNWHPRRARTVRYRGKAATWDAARAAFRQACAEGPVAIVDGRPGRAASALYRAFVTGCGKGSYRPALCREERALTSYESLTGANASELGYDLENNRTLLSLGVPLLDGWGVPGHVQRLWAERRDDWNVIQVEPELSRTASLASQWVAPVERRSWPAAFATGLAAALVEEKLTPEAAAGPGPSMRVLEAAGRAGLAEERLREAARTLAAGRPALVLANDPLPEVAALNVLLGAVDAPGGVVRRRPPNGPLGAVTAGERPRAAVLDSMTPWDYTAPAGAEVFRFSAWEGCAGEADGWLLPAPGFLEELTDVPAPPAMPRETYAIAAALLAPPVETESAARFLEKAAGEMGVPVDGVEKGIVSRCEAIYASRRGRVWLNGAEEPAPVTGLESAAKLRELLESGGGVWTDDAPAKESAMTRRLAVWPEERPAGGFAPVAWAEHWTPPVLPPLATKLYQESHLRPASDRRIS